MFTTPDNAMRATFQPQSRQASESREATPKPGETDPTKQSEELPDQIIYDTPVPKPSLPDADPQSSGTAGETPPKDHLTNDSHFPALGPAAVVYDPYSIPANPPCDSNGKSTSGDHKYPLNLRDSSITALGDATPSSHDSTSTDTSQNMSDNRPSGSTSEQERSSGRGRSHSQSARRPRPQPSQPFPTLAAAGLYPTPEGASTSSAPPSFHGHQLPYGSAPPTSAPPYIGVPQHAAGRGRGGYGPTGGVGQYTMSPPQPPVNMVHHNHPTYAYPQHPGLLAPDPSVTALFNPQNQQPMGYPTNTLVPMMQAYSPYPVPPPQHHSPDGSSNSSHNQSFTSAANVAAGGGSSGSTMYPSHHTSPSSHTPLGPPTSRHQHQQPSYPRYPTPPSYYSPHSFAHGHSGTPHYQSPTYPSPYPTPYSPEQEVSPSGTWWYLPPIPRPPPSNQYESFATHPAYSPMVSGDPGDSGYPPPPHSSASSASGMSAVATSSSPLYPMSPRQGMQPQVGSPLPPSFPYHSRGPSAPEVSPHPTASVGHSRTPLPPDLPPSSSPSTSTRPVIPVQPIPFNPSGSTSATNPPGGTPVGGTERATRRPYHPNPPAHRSEWVMWAGNVPSDATHDELWRFFNQVPSPGSVASNTSSGGNGSSPLSTRSGPAGVNFGASSSSSSGPQGPSSLPAPRRSPITSPHPPSVPVDPPQSATSSYIPPPAVSTLINTSPTDIYGGVSSIFLISRSNCAFINFQSQAHLHAAIAHFNGAPLRPGDHRCARLVCRVRGKDDDLKAGVGGQRGAGMHVKWVKDQKEKDKALRASQGASPEVDRRSSISSSDRFTATTPSSSPSERPPTLANLSDEEAAAMGAAMNMRRVRGQGRGSFGAGLGGGPTGKPIEPHHSSSSGSFASTNSSILTKYFPKRYFILKSLTQFDLDLSVEKGLWATQRHNEGILDQAFRTSKETYLIFGVNKSGEFYGYAKMTSPISQGEQRRVSWASRTDSSQRSSDPDAPHDFFSPSEDHTIEESPLPVSPETTSRADKSGRGAASAPAELHQPHHQLSKLTAGATQGQTSLDVSKLKPMEPILLQTQQEQDDDFELDIMAPIRAAKERSGRAPVEMDEEDGVKRWDSVGTGATPLDPVEEREEGDDLLSRDEKGKGRAVEDPTTAAHGTTAAVFPGREEGPVWGESFRVEWIRTNRLPFHRTRHLRNPWNHDREVKVSRDGTELEPSVGQALLDEWDKPDAQNAAAPSPTAERPAGTKSVTTDTVGSESTQEGRER